MRYTKYLNPFFIFRNRHLIPTYVRSSCHDVRCKALDVVNDVRASLAEKGLGLSLNDHRFAAMKDIHRGRRAFIIGNGPSLRISDLEKLQDEITFASNNVFVAFEDTPWRPTYYSCYEGGHFSDPEPVRAGYYKQLIEKVRMMKFIPMGEKRFCAGADNIVYFHNAHHWFYPNKPVFSRNALGRIYWGGTTTYILLQLAYYMGIEDFYLIGVDHDYKQDPSKDVGILEYGSWRGNFHPKYNPPGAAFYDLSHHVETWTLAYESARDAIEFSGRRIFNATRGGKLEVFPRVDFDQVVK